MQPIRVADLFKLSRAMPDRTDIPSVLLQLSEISAETGVSFQSITPHDAVFDKVVSNVQEVKARGGRVIAITTRDEDSLDGKLDYEFRIPETKDMLTPVVASVPLQLLAYYIAVKRGTNVDQPRNLAKSVTVE